MRVTVTDLLGHPGATRRVVVGVERADIEAPEGAWGPADEALASTIDVDIHLEMLVDGLLARGTFTFSTSVPCARCLTEVARDHVVEVSEFFTDPTRLDDEDEVEPGYELHPEGEIDLETAIRDAILATLPVRALCSGGCLGLCPTCGADLNLGACGHDQALGPDPRWKPLQGLRLPPG